MGVSETPTDPVTSTHSHSCSLSLNLHEKSLNIDMKMIRPVKSSGVTLNFDSNSWTLSMSCNVLNPVKNIPLEFHRLFVNCVQSSVLW